MKKLIPLSLIFMLLFLSCEEEGNANEQGNTQVNTEDSTQLSSDLTEAASPLIGRWELVEKRIPDIGAIPLGNIFYTFGADGLVQSEHKDDSGIGQEKGSYTLQDKLLYFNETQYEIVSLQKDTLHLQSNTDGITENSLFIRR
jgi:hypothetical protein